VYWGIPFALLLVCCISYGVLIPWLGFYWDDWPTVWYLHVFGPRGFAAALAIDRPLLASLFMATTPVMGESIIAWQVFGLLTRWLSCLAVWWMLRQAWPDRPLEAGWASLLFAVYPGFQQQYISVTYSHTFLTLAGFFLSLGLMIAAVRRPRFSWPLYLASWALATLVLFIEEYYFGLELLRPVFLWMAFGERYPAPPSGRRFARLSALFDKRRLLRTAAAWAPYLLTILAFLAWRLLLSSTPRGEVQVFDRLGSSPLQAAIDLGKTILVDILETGVLAWGQVVRYLQTLPADWRIALAYLAVVLAAGGVTAFFLNRLAKSLPGSEGTGPQSRGSHSAHWGLSALAIGVFSLMLGGWPFWATYLPIKLKFPWDRFTLPMMFGASLALAGVLASIRLPVRWKNLILAGVVGLSAGMHLQVANIYRQDWNLQKSFFWQMAWRMPGVEPGTALLTASLPLKYFTDNSLTAPTNWLFAPGFQGKPPQMPFLLYDIKVRQESGSLALQPGYSIQQPYRIASFSGSTDQALALAFTPPGCLKVIDAQTRDWPGLPPLVKEAGPLSNVQRIRARAEPGAVPPEHIFGPEPGHNWCYYFEKVELANQEQDYPAAAALGKEALSKGLHPGNAAEWTALMHAFAGSGDLDQALQAGGQAASGGQEVRKLVCSFWKEKLLNLPETGSEAQTIRSWLAEARCTEQ
jgi:hypothetical protein